MQETEADDDDQGRGRGMGGKRKRGSNDNAERNRVLRNTGQLNNWKLKYNDEWKDP